MPSTRSPRLRRPVVVAPVMLLWLLAGPAATASASPLDLSPFDLPPVGGGPAGSSSSAEAQPAVVSPVELGMAPMLTLPVDVTFVVGRSGDSYLLDADGDPVPTISVAGLPRGLRVTAYADGSAVLHGTATGPAGVTTVQVRAKNAEAVSYQSLTVVVQQRPAFTDRKPLVFDAGVFTSVTVRTTGFPAPGIGLDGDLPAGLTFVDLGDGTGTISGTPLGGPESAPITLTAVNEVADASLTTTVEVVAAPDSSSDSSDSANGPTR